MLPLPCFAPKSVRMSCLEIWTSKLIAMTIVKASHFPTLVSGEIREEA
jgi:hypothetical protein